MRPVELAQHVATLTLLLGFWCPPILVGRWAAARERRDGVAHLHPVALVNLTALAWAFVWLVLNVLLQPPCVPREPGDPCDAPGYVAMGFAFLAAGVVFPVSVLVCWLARRFWLQRRSNDPETSGDGRFAGHTRR